MPLIRVFLIMVVGVLVYRNFDSLWPRLRSLVRSTLSNRSLVSGRESSSLAWSFSGDSTRAFLQRGRAGESEWCEAMDRMRSGLCGETRSIMEKARWLRAMNKPVLSKVDVHIPKNESGYGEPALATLEGIDGETGFRYQRLNGDHSAPWCDSTRGCLSSLRPRVPLNQGWLTDTATDELVSRWTSSSPLVFPALPGMVVQLDSSGPDHLRVILYHGRELYTTYESLRSFAGHLKTGDRVDTNNSIGMAAPVDSSAASNSFINAMVFRVERAGMPLDPMSFFPAEMMESNVP